MQNVATRTDTRLQISETFEFFGSGRLAGTTHAPMAPPRAAVLVCPSIGIDFVRSYRGEVDLARELASRGIATQRFHFRGTGHSDGDPALVDFDSMCEDAMAALEHLKARSGADRTAVVGTRVGALVAAAVGAAVPAAPVAAIEPVLEGRRFFREGFRARMVHGVAQGDDRPSTSGALMAELEERGSIDLVGYRVHQNLVRTLEGQRFAEVLGTEPRPLLVVQLSSTEPRADLVDFVTTREAAGLPVEVLRYAGGGTWWFIDDDEQTQAEWIPDVANWISGLWGSE